MFEDTGRILRGIAVVIVVFAAIGGIAFGIYASAALEGNVNPVFRILVFFLCFIGTSVTAWIMSVCIHALGDIVSYLRIIAATCEEDDEEDDENDEENDEAGKWRCSVCNALNSAKATSCYKCETIRRQRIRK